MTTPFRVDLEKLDVLIARINGLAGFIRDELDELDRRVDGLHLESWSGAAATAHLEAHREWSTAAGDFAQHAQRMSLLAATAHSVYTAAMDANSRMLRPQT